MSITTGELNILLILLAHSWLINHKWK